MFELLFLTFEKDRGYLTKTLQREKRTGGEPKPPPPGFGSVGFCQIRVLEHVIAWLKERSAVAHQANRWQFGGVV